MTSSQIIQMYVLCIDRDPYRLQVLADWAIAEDTVNQPNPSVKPHASDAMTKSSLVTSSRTKCGGRNVFISKQAGRALRCSSRVQSGHTRAALDSRSVSAASHLNMRIRSPRTESEGEEQS